MAARPDVKGTVEQVMSGELFSGLLIDDIGQRALALEAVLGKVVDDDTRVVWVGNPLRAPLTIERFLIQIVGPEIDLRVEHGAADLARIIAKPVGRASRLLIIVQQPETINAETRDLLVGMGGYLGGEAVQVQFLFAGSPAFTVPRLAPAEIAAFSPKSPAADTETIQFISRRRDIVPLVVLLVATTMGVMISMAPASEDGMPQSAPVSAPAPPPIPAPLTHVMILRREFDTFLTERASSLPPMTGSQKDALFTEFLTHHHRE